MIFLNSACTKENSENFKRNGISLARELDDSFSQFPYGLQLAKLSDKNSDENIKRKRRELDQDINRLKYRSDKNFRANLENLLEAKEEFVKSNNSYVQRQLEKSKKRLLDSKKVSVEEIENVCELQEELTVLELLQEQELEARQEIQ
ncbi:18411_t:CDS:2 [Gigaspora rosea]|nr:18411_t:CDS:2 [Gigaspora rosea]